MPVNIIPGSMKFKDSNGQYQEITGLKGDPGDATIDDVAGIGDFDKVWSADKTATEINDLKSAIDDIDGTLDTGIKNAFPFEWYHCYFDASGNPVANNRNVSPTNAPFLLKAGKPLYVDPDIYTGGYAVYTLSGGVYSRIAIQTITEETTVLFGEDTYITLNFRSDSEIDLNTLTITIDTIAGLKGMIDNAQRYTSTLQNKFHPTGDYKYWYSNYGLILPGTLIISNCPTGMQFSVRAYSDDTYSTKIYDSGFKTTSFAINIETAAYYEIYFLKSNASQIFDFTVFDSLTVEYTTTILKTVEDNEKLIKAVETVGIYDNKLIRSIGHRGDCIYAPENTAPAYIAAKKHGVNIVENDIFLTSDGEYMCWHDDTLSKCGNLLDVNGYLIYTDGTVFYYFDSINSNLYTWNGTNYVASSVDVGTLTRCAGSSYYVNTMPSTWLKRIDVGIYKGTQFQGTTMLKMDEWILLCKQLGLEIYLDTKVSQTEGTINDWLQILDRYGMRDHASWLSVFVPLISHLKEADPNARVGMLAVPTQALIDSYKQYNTGRGFFFNGAIADTTAETTLLGISNGFDVECWYANSGVASQIALANIANAISYGVTGITMDHYRVDEAFSGLLN